MASEEDKEDLRDLSKKLREAKRNNNTELITYYQSCIDTYDLSDQIGAEKKLESIDGLLSQVNSDFFKSLKIDDFCNKLGDILKAWEAADVQLKIARLRLMNEGQVFLGLFEIDMMN